MNDQLFIDSMQARLVAIVQRCNTAPLKPPMFYYTSHMSMISRYLIDIKSHHDSIIPESPFWNIKAIIEDDVVELERCDFESQAVLLETDNDFDLHMRVDRFRVVTQPSAHEMRKIRKMTAAPSCKMVFG